MVKLQPDMSEGTTTKDAQKKKGFSLLRTTKSAASGTRRLIPFTNRRLKQPEIAAKVEPPIRQISFTHGGSAAPHESDQEGERAGDASHVSSLTDRDGMNRAAATAEQNTQSSISSKSSAFSYSKIGSDKKVITTDMKLFSKHTTMPQLENSGKPLVAKNDPDAEARAPTTSPVAPTGRARVEPEETRVPIDGKPHAVDTMVVGGEETAEHAMKSNSPTKNGTPSLDVPGEGSKKSPKKKSKSPDAQDGASREPPPGEALIPPPPPSRRSPATETDKKLAFEKVRALLNRVNPRSHPRNEDLSTPKVNNTAHAPRRPVDPSPVNEDLVEQDMAKPEPSPTKLPAVKEDTDVGKTDGKGKSSVSLFRIKSFGKKKQRSPAADPPTSPIVERKAVDAPGEESSKNENDELFPDLLGDHEDGSGVQDQPIREVQKHHENFEFPDVLGEKPNEVLNKDDMHSKHLLAENSSLLGHANDIASREIDELDKLLDSDSHEETEKALSPNENTEPFRTATKNSVSPKKTEPVDAIEKKDTKETPTKFVFDEESSYSETPTAEKKEARRSFDKTQTSMRLRVLQTSVAPKSKTRRSIESNGANERAGQVEEESSDDEIPAPAIDTEAMLAALESALPPRNPSRSSTSPRRKSRSRRKKSSGPLTEPNDVQKAFNRKANAIAERHSEKRRLSDGKAKAERKVAAAKALAKSSVAKEKKTNKEIKGTVQENDMKVAPGEVNSSTLPSHINVSSDDPVSDLDRSVRNYGLNSTMLLDQKRDDVESVSAVESQDEDNDRYAPLFTVLTPDSPIKGHSTTKDIENETTQLEGEDIGRKSNCVEGTQEHGSFLPNEGPSKRAVLADEITEWTGESALGTEAIEMVIPDEKLIISSPCSANDVLECLALNEPNREQSNTTISASGNNVAPDNFATSESHNRTSLIGPTPVVRICEADEVLEILALDDKTVDLSEGGVGFDFPKVTSNISHHFDPTQATETARDHPSSEVIDILELLALDDKTVDVSEGGLGFEFVRVLSSMGATSTPGDKVKNERETGVSTFLAQSPTSFGVEATESQYFCDLIESSPIQRNSKTDAQFTNNFERDPLGILSMSGSKSQSRTERDVLITSSAETGPVEPQPMPDLSQRNSTSKSEVVDESDSVSCSAESDDILNDGSDSGDQAKQIERAPSPEDTKEAAQINDELSEVVPATSEDPASIPSLPFDPTGKLPIDSEASRGSVGKAASASTSQSDQESRDMSTVPQKSPEFVDLDCYVDPSDDSKGAQSSSDQANTNPNHLLSNNINQKGSLADGPNRAPFSPEFIDLTSYLSMDDVDEAVWLFDVPGPQGNDQESDVESIVDLTLMKIGGVEEILSSDRPSALDSVIKYGNILLEEKPTEQAPTNQTPTSLSKKNGLLVPSFSEETSAHSERGSGKLNMDGALDNEGAQLLCVVQGKDVDKESAESQTVVQGTATPLVYHPNHNVQIPRGRVWQRNDLYPIDEDQRQLVISDDGSDAEPIQEQSSDASDREIPQMGKQAVLSNAFVPSVLPENLQRRKPRESHHTSRSHHPLNAVISLEERSRTSVLTEDHNSKNWSRPNEISEDQKSGIESMIASENESVESTIHPSNAGRVKPSPEFLLSNGRGVTHTQENVRSRQATSRLSHESFSLATRNPRDAYSTGEAELESTGSVILSQAQSSVVFSESVESQDIEDYSTSMDSGKLMSSQNSDDNLTSSSLFETNKEARTTSNKRSETHLNKNAQRRLPKPEVEPRERSPQRLRTDNDANLRETKNGKDTISPLHNSEHQSSTKIQHDDGGYTSSESFEVVEWKTSRADKDCALRQQVQEHIDIEDATHSSLIVDPMAVPIGRLDGDSDRPLSSPSLDHEETSEAMRQDEPRDRILALRDVVDAVDVNETKVVVADSPEVLIGSPVPVSSLLSTDYNKEAEIGSKEKSPISNVAEKEGNAAILNTFTKPSNQKSESTIIGVCANEMRRDAANENTTTLSDDTGPLPIYVHNPLVSKTYSNAHVRQEYKAQKRSDNDGAKTTKQTIQPPHDRDMLDLFFEGAESLFFGKSVSHKSKRFVRVSDELEDSVLAENETNVMEQKSLVASDNTNCAVVANQEKCDRVGKKDILDTVFEGAESLLCLDDDDPRHCFRNTRGAREDNVANENGAFADALGPLPESCRDIFVVSISDSAATRNVPAQNETSSDEYDDIKEAGDYNGSINRFIAVEGKDVVLPENSDNVGPVTSGRVLAVSPVSYREPLKSSSIESDLTRSSPTDDNHSYQPVAEKSATTQVEVQETIVEKSDGDAFSSAHGNESLGEESIKDDRGFGFKSQMNHHSRNENDDSSKSGVTRNGIVMQRNDATRATNEEADAAASNGNETEKDLSSANFLQQDKQDDVLEHEQESETTIDIYYRPENQLSTVSETKGHERNMVLSDSGHSSEQLLLPNNNSGDNELSQSCSTSAAVASHGKEPKNTNCAIKKKETSLGTDEKPVSPTSEKDSDLPFSPAESTLAFDFSRSEELVDEEDAEQVIGEHAVSRQEEILPDGVDTLPSPVNRGVDPPSFSDSSTQQSSSFESSNKVATMESEICDDTIPSKPVILPDFETTSEDNIRPLHEGVEVSVSPQGTMSECLSFVTELENMPSRQDPVALSPGVPYRRKALEPPSPVRSCSSPRKRGADPPTSDTYGEDLIPLPEDPPSGDGGLGRPWSDDTTENEKMAEESSDSSPHNTSNGSLAEVRQIEHSFEDHNGHQRLDGESALVIVSTLEMEIPVVAATDVSEVDENETTMMATVLASVVAATDTSVPIDGNGGEADGPAIGSVARAVAALEKKVEDGSQSTDRVVGSRAISPSSFAGHSESTKRILNTGVWSTDEYEANETDEGVEISIRDVMSSVYLSQDLALYSDDQNQNGQEDKQEGSNVLSSPQSYKSVKSFDNDTAEGVTCSNNKSVDDSTSFAAAVNDPLLATDPKSIENESDEQVSIDRVVAARTSMVESGKRDPRSESLDEQQTTNGTFVEKNSDGNSIFPLVAQLTDSSWCVGFPSLQSEALGRDNARDQLNDSERAVVSSSTQGKTGIESQNRNRTLVHKKIGGLRRIFSGSQNSKSVLIGHSSSSSDVSTDQPTSDEEQVVVTVNTVNNLAKIVTNRSSPNETSSSDSGIVESTSPKRPTNEENERAKDNIEGTDKKGLDSPSHRKNNDNEGVSHKSDTSNDEIQFDNKEIPYSCSEKKEAGTAVKSSLSSPSLKDMMKPEAQSISASSEPGMIDSVNKSSLSRVERVRAMSESPDFTTGFSRPPRATDSSVSSEPELLVASSKDKQRSSSRFSRSPRLQNVLDRLKRRHPSRRGATMESSSADSSENEPVDVNDLFSRYDSIVKNMVVNDQEKLDRIQKREAVKATPQSSSQSSFQSPLIDVTYLGSDVDVKFAKSATKSEKLHDDLSISDLRASPTRKKQPAKLESQRPVHGNRNPMLRSNSFSSASEFSVTPSQKARDLRKQLDQALKTSAAIRNSQEKLNTEISTFKSRLQWQSHLSPQNLSPRSRRLSPSQKSYTMAHPTSSNEAYVSLSDLRRQGSHQTGTTNSVIGGDSTQAIKSYQTDDAVQSFQPSQNGSNKSAYVVDDNQVDLYLSPSAPSDDSDSDEIRSQQVDSILNGLAQSQTSSPKKSNN